jgi:hypothetical protein
MMRTRGFILLVILLCGIATGVVAESTAGSEPEPYTSEEFPLWARNLRRAEIVATGTLPLTLLASRLIYGLVRFVVKSIQAGAIDMAYAPGFLSSPGAVPLTRTEKLGILGGAGGLSIVVALIDL